VTTSTRARLLPFLTAAAAALAATGLAEGRPAGPTSSPDFLPQLVVEPSGANFASDGRQLVIAVDLTASPRPAGRITVDVPRGQQLYPDRGAGRPVGKAYAYLRATGNRASPLRRYSGPISSEPAAGDLDEQAQRCRPARYQAIWLARLSGAQGTIPLTIGISDAGTGRLRLDLCPQIGATAQGAARTPAVVAVVLVLADLDAPAEPGLYRWRALVTPRLPDGSATDERATYELRALVPVPHTLTLRGRLLAAPGRVRLTGSLRARGRPQPGHLIEITTLDRTITPRGVAFHDAPAGVTATTRSGSYRLDVPIRSTRGFVAATPPTAERCSGVAAAPAGCLTTTTSGVESDPVTIGVP
jgi:hypothetical protein